MEKILYLMRGISGSGKSTEATKLGQGGVVIGTDSFFMHNGVYQFDLELLPQAHANCEQRVEQALAKGISPVVVDNTNLERWEAKPYVQLAARYGYTVKVAEPQTPWKLDAQELTQRNRHGVSLERIQEMIGTYHQNNPFTAEEILKSQQPNKQASVWYNRYLDSDRKIVSYFV